MTGHMSGMTHDTCHSHCIPYKTHGIWQMTLLTHTWHVLCKTYRHAAQGYKAHVYLARLCYTSLLPSTVRTSITLQGSQLSLKKIIKPQSLHTCCLSYIESINNRLDNLIRTGIFQPNTCSSQESHRGGSSREHNERVAGSSDSSDNDKLGILV